MKQEVVVKEKANLALPDAPEGAWGAENTHSKDILIPKLLLMQGLSEYVVDGKAKLGDLVDSVNGKILGGKEESVEVIPIMLFNTWSESEIINGKPQYKGELPVTAKNSHLPWEEIVDGVKIKRVQKINVYVLLADEATSPLALPYLISFKSTSYREGQKLSTHFLLSQKVNQAPARTVFSIQTRVDKNDDGTFGVFEISESGSATKEQVNAAFSWYKTIKSGATKVDDADTAGEKVAAQF